MKTNIRIKKYDKGYVVEQQRSFLFWKYWTHLISAAGMSDVPWYFSSFDYAMAGLLDEVKWDVMNVSDCYSN